MSLQQVTDLLSQEKNIARALKGSLEVMLLLISILVNRLGLNSSNSSKPPVTDRHRKKEAKKESGRKPGGQHGYIGKTLKQVADPDIIKPIPVDRSLLPPAEYRKIGHEVRQIIDLDFSTVVTEYQAEVLEDQRGTKYAAPFPEGVTRLIQYGIGVKVNAVYLSQYQTIPYNRIEEEFIDQMQMPISAGSLY